MPKACVFCGIVNGEVDAYRVYEDNHITAFLDIYPLSKGHTLVVPKAHVDRIEFLDERLSTMLFKAVWKLTKRIQRATNTNASLIAINNGLESGQEIPHVHVHIVPRHRGDGGGPIQVAMPNRPKVSPDEMRMITQRIISEIDSDPSD